MKLIAIISVSGLLWTIHPTSPAIAADEEVTQIEAPKMDHKRSKHVTTMTTAGYAIVAISGFFLTAHYPMLPLTYYHEIHPWLGLHFMTAVFWQATYFVGVPLLLSAYIKTKSSLGLEPNDGLSVSGWVLYAATGALIALSYASFETFSTKVEIASWIGSGVTATASMILSLVAGRRATRMRGKDLLKATVIPSIVPVSGGAMIGLGGTF